MYVFKMMSWFKKFETQTGSGQYVFVQYNLFYWSQKPDTYIGAGFNVKCTCKVIFNLASYFFRKMKAEKRKTAKKAEIFRHIRKGWAVWKRIKGEG